MHRFNLWVRKIPWRRKWQPTPVLLPGESHGRRSLVGYSPRGRKESDTTERLHFHFHFGASWAGNKDTVLLYWTVKYTEAQPLAEDVCTWQCMPDTWINFCDWICEHMFISLKTQLEGSYVWDGDWSHEIKRCLLLGRKVMTNLDSIFKSRDITLPTKVHLVKAMVFPVVMYRCESWTVKKAERRRIDAFELWCWRRLLRVPWTARRSNQSILKEISPGISLEGMMLKLKL